MEVVVKPQIQEDVLTGSALIVTTDNLKMGETISLVNSMLRPRDNSINFFFMMRLKQEELSCKGTFLSFDKINEEDNFSRIQRGIKTKDEYLRLIVTIMQEHLLCPEKEIFKEDGSKNMFVVSMSDSSLQNHVLVVKKDENGWHADHDSWSWDGMARNAEKRFFFEQEIGTRFFFVQAPGF